MLVGGAAAAVSRRLDPRRIHEEDEGETHRDRWHFVTINRPPDEVMPGDRPPGPLAEMVDKIDLQMRRAPRNRGTELGARLIQPVPTGPAETIARLTGDDPRQKLRKALRETKMLLETGEILQADKPPTTRPTLRSIPVKLATRRARGEGRL
jgi:hypothetical protein